MQPNAPAYKPPTLGVHEAKRLITKRRSYNSQLVRACSLVQGASPKIGPVLKDGISKALFEVFGYTSDRD
jgi:hypothetical protein